jgi:hypothetical protein
MTEAEWLVCDDPSRLLEFLRDKVSSRSLRLFAAASCRSIWPLLVDERSRNAVEAAENWAKGWLSREELHTACRGAEDAFMAAMSPACRDANAPRTATCAAARAALLSLLSDAYQAAHRASYQAANAARRAPGADFDKDCALANISQARLLRELIGNPFSREAMPEAEWLAATEPGPMLAALWGRASDRKVKLFACACCRRIRHLLADGRSRVAVEAGERFADGQAGLGEVNAAADAAEQAAVDLEPDPEPVAGGITSSKSVRRQASNPARAARAAWLAAWVGNRSPGYNPDSDPALAAADAAGDCAAALGWGAARPMEDAAREAVGRGAREEGWETLRQAVEARDAARSAEQLAQADLVRDIFGYPFRPVTVDPSWLTSAAVGLARCIYEDRASDELPILADALEDAGCTDRAILDHCRGPGPHVRGCWVVDLLLGKE